MKSGFQIVAKRGLTTVFRNGQEIGWIQVDLRRALYRALTANGSVYHCNTKDSAFDRIVSDYYKENNYAAH